uniref:Uncharacterized protein n=1 Tax=Vitis vinifera TaxID=29760 RepID=A5BYQ2_VITVI|nr:hypothetical protein VITISV_018140 [Vitis vinifera]
MADEFCTRLSQNHEDLCLLSPSESGVKFEKKNRGGGLEAGTSGERCIQLRIARVKVPANYRKSSCFYSTVEELQDMLNYMASIRSEAEPYEYHTYCLNTYCLNPPIVRIPEGKWYCPFGVAEDDDEDYVEAGGTAAVNQEIKRTITEVPVKVTDELFDEIVAKVLIRYDMTVEVDDRIVTSNHKVSQISPLVLTPKVSVKVLIPVEDKETETEAVSRKSSSGSPGDVFSLGSYAFDHDAEDDEFQNPHVPKPICSTIQCNGTTESIDSIHRIIRRLISPFDLAGCKQQLPYSLAEPDATEVFDGNLRGTVDDAENASNSDSLVGPVRGISDNRPLDLLEGKLAVLQFQIWIKEELEAIASSLANTVREKVRGVSLVLKSITQLYNEYAIPFELWEIRLEMLYFADYSGDADGSDSTCEAAAGLPQEISSINLYKESVAESGAIEEITGLLRHSSLTSEVKEQSICTLWNLSADEKLRMKIANTDLLPLAIKSLEDEDIKVKEAAGGVLVNLALSKSLHSIMVEAGGSCHSANDWCGCLQGLDTRLNIDDKKAEIDESKINAVVGRTQQQFLARIGVIEVEDERKSQSVSTSQRFTLLPWMDGVAWLVLILGLEDKLSIILDKRCKISESYAKKMVEVMKELELPRQNNKLRDRLMQNSGTVMELVELLMGKEDLKRGNSGWYKDVSLRIVESHIPEMSRQAENIKEAGNVSIIFRKQLWKFASAKEIQELGYQTTVKLNIVKLDWFMATMRVCIPTELLIQALMKSRNFELYVPCLTNVGENPFELTDQVTLYMEMFLTTEYPDDELGPSIPNSETPFHHGNLAIHTFSSICFFD